MFRLGRRRLASAAARRGGRGSTSFLSSGALESLLDEQDVREAGWESWQGDSVQQVQFVAACFVVSLDYFGRVPRALAVGYK